MAFGLLPVLPDPVLAQTLRHVPGQPGLPGVACGAGNNSPACQAIRRALPSPEGHPTPPGAPSRVPSYAPPRGWDDVRGKRFIPPRIEAFLNDPRISPLLRAYLRSMAAKPTDEWTLADLQTVTAVVPTLTEMQNPIPTARIGEFYQFLGLDPTSLFEPRLGDWQSASTAFDPRNFAGGSPECPTLFQRRWVDPAEVRLRDLAACPKTSYGQLR